MKVKDAMSANVKTIAPEASLKDAAASFAEHRIGGAPVVDREGGIVGVLTDTDILLKERAGSPRSDPEIERDIREEALRGLSWTEDLDLSVESGEVTLRGEVESKYDAEALPDVIRRIPGVVGVDSELTAWDVEKNRKVVVAARRP
jgi:CBS domain-containing protein